MKPQEITIRVDSDAADAYRAAPEQERRKLDLLLSMRIREATRSQGSLEGIIGEISRNAEARGLTPDILRSILDEQ